MGHHSQMRETGVLASTLILTVKDRGYMVLYMPVWQIMIIAKCHPYCHWGWSKLVHSIYCGRFRFGWVSTSKCRENAQGNVKMMVNAQVNVTGVYLRHLWGGGLSCVK